MVTKSRGRSSERIAKGVLQELGYRIIETNKRVSIGQAEAFEVDIIALNQEGEEHCVEVKAGLAGISDIRHVYADSEVLGLKPLLVCKGFANEAAEAMSMELGVKVVRLSEHFILLEPEELEVVVRTAMRDILNEYGFYPLPPWEAIEDEDWEVIEGLARSESFEEAAHHLHLNAEELGHRIGELREDGVFPQGGQPFKELKRHSQQLIHRYSLDRRLEKIEMRLKSLE